jgi:hypothetical protein
VTSSGLAGLLKHAPELARGVTEAYAGITGAFERAVRRFFAIACHPVLGRLHQVRLPPDARAD